MVNEFVNIKYGYHNCYTQLQVFYNGGAVAKLVFQVQANEHHQRHQGYGGRVHDKTGRQIALQQQQKTTLQPTAGAFNMKVFFRRAGEHIRPQPLKKTIVGSHYTGIRVCDGAFTPMGDKILFYNDI
jgi:hypothetical protein